MRATVWLPDSSSLPGTIGEVDLPVTRAEERCLALPRVTVEDVREEGLFDSDDLRFEHHRGGGHLASEQCRREARAFGVVNIAYHLEHGLQRIETLLGRPLPRLIARIGMHADQNPAWNGGHYRLPAPSYSELPERGSIDPGGEIHLGAGGKYIPYHGGRYFHAPAHNPAIIYHELGHHVCRHTADFRLNRRRPPNVQGNRKIPLDEGTSDFIAAILLGTADIYAWQRWDVPRSSQKRRHLDAPWTMRDYVGSARNDPHIDGTVWSASLWAARTAVSIRGTAPEHFDRLVLRALDSIGESGADLEWNEALRLRRHFSAMLEAILQADEECGHCSSVIEAVFAERGIHPGQSNRDLRERARDALVSMTA